MNYTSKFNWEIRLGRGNNVTVCKWDRYLNWGSYVLVAGLLYNEEHLLEVMFSIIHDLAYIYIHHAVNCFQSLYFFMIKLKLFIQGFTSGLFRWIILGNISQIK